MHCMQEKGIKGIKGMCAAFSIKLIQQAGRCVFVYVCFKKFSNIIRIF